MNSRSLPQNKAPFSSDQLAKFVVFGRQSVPMTLALSLRTEDTIVTRRSRGTCWDLEPVVGVARDSGATLGNHGLATRCHCRSLTSTELGPAISPPSEPNYLLHAANRTPELLDRRRPPLMREERE